MVTAICKNENCTQKNIEYYVSHRPIYVECGSCAQPTELINFVDDVEVPYVVAS